jgi:hypothetical protein
MLEPRRPVSRSMTGGTGSGSCRPDSGVHGTLAGGLGEPSELVLDAPRRRCKYALPSDAPCGVAEAHPGSWRSGWGRPSFKRGEPVALRLESCSPQRVRQKSENVQQCPTSGRGNAQVRRLVLCPQGALAFIMSFWTTASPDVSQPSGSRQIRTPGCVAGPLVSTGSLAAKTLRRPGGQAG